MGIASGVFVPASERPQATATSHSTEQAKACDFGCSIGRDPLMAAVALAMIAVAAWIVVQRRSRAGLLRPAR